MLARKSELCPMFTGIIETTGRVSDVRETGTNLTLWIESPLSGQLKVDQSLAHNGICLTIEEVQEGKHRVSAVQETLQKTTLKGWKSGTSVNLERCLAFGSRMDGHWVQGHVDTTAICTSREDLEGSWQFRFRYPPTFAPLLIEKGSIALDGISLTVFDVKDDCFSVAIIPYTFEHTTMNALFPGMEVNLEFDVLGKYVQRILQLR